MMLVIVKAWLVIVSPLFAWDGLEAPPFSKFFRYRAYAFFKSFAKSFNAISFFGFVFAEHRICAVD